MKAIHNAKKDLIEKVIRASPYLVVWEDVTDEVSRVVLDASPKGLGIALVTIFPNKMIIQNAMMRTWASVKYDDTESIYNWLSPLVTVKNSRLLGLI